jgi:hypothetical protein
MQHTMERRLIGKDTREEAFPVFEMRDRESFQPVTPKLLIKMPFHADLIPLLCHLRHTSFSSSFSSSFFSQAVGPDLFLV